MRTCYAVTIPMEVAKALNLEKGDLAIIRCEPKERNIKISILKFEELAKRVAGNQGEGEEGE